MLNDLQAELDKIFTFEWDYSPVYAQRHLQFNAIRGQAYTNIEITNADYNIKGIANHYSEDKDGAVIIQYAMCRQIREAGDQLPEPMSRLQNCELHYYGLLLNCLAVLSGRHIKKLLLRDCYNGKDYPVRYNPGIAEKFLATITESKVVGQTSRQSQFSLFTA